MSETPEPEQDEPGDELDPILANEPVTDPKDVPPDEGDVGTAPGQE